MVAGDQASLKDTIADCQARVQKAKERLLTIFSFVPDDKLTWSPSPTSRSALSLMAHCARSNGTFAKIILGEMPAQMPSRDQMREAARQFEAGVRDRKEAVRLLEKSADDLISAIASVTPERFALSPNSPFGAFPMVFWMKLADAHMTAHAAHMNYLQTIWGDMVDHAM